MYRGVSSNTLASLRREHALCFMHRHTLRTSGLVFWQSFDTSLLNQQLPTPLPRRVVNKMVKMFER